MKLLDDSWFAAYMKSMDNSLFDDFRNFTGGIEDVSLNYRIQASAVYSSNIEGNTLDLNSYLNIKMKNDVKSRKKDVSEIDDLLGAYEYARKNDLNQNNFLEAHRLLSKRLLIKSKRGKYRNEAIGVCGEEGLIYVAVEWIHLSQIMNQLFEEIELLLSSDISLPQILYYASFLHLRFVHIHPFVDGNGRAARLLEKWFLTRKTGTHYWGLLTEKHYKINQADYYKTINLGVNYYELDYNKCIPFLTMLPGCIKTS